MIIAFLFNRRAYPANVDPWHFIRDAAFSPGIIQRSNRLVKLSVGDVLAGLKPGQDERALFAAAFGQSEWNKIDGTRLSLGFPTVFGLVFENMPTALAEELGNALHPHRGYIGALSVHFEYPPHLALYRLTLPPLYRIEGRRLRRLHADGEQDGCDRSELDAMRRLGYPDADFEDTGARRALDSCDMPRHFERVAALRTLLRMALPGGEDDASQLTMMLEDQNPKLFNALGGAAEGLASAGNGEDVVRAAISARRYLQHLAQDLRPEATMPADKRRRDRTTLRSRLRAVARVPLKGDRARLSAIGRDLDRIVHDLHAGHNAGKAREQVAYALTDAAILTATLLALHPDSSGHGCPPQKDSLLAFTRRLSAQIAQQIQAARHNTVRVQERQPKWEPG